MDYYKNIDHICDDCSPFSASRSLPEIQGIQYRVVADLSTEPVDLPFFKQHARIDFNLDDNLCASYIKAARQELERWAQISFGKKTIELLALRLPKTYYLLNGPVEQLVESTDHTLFGDILKGGGEEVTVRFETKENPFPEYTETIKIAICRYAAGLYAIREHIVSDSKGNPVNGESLKNEAKNMLQPIRNISWP